MCANYALAVDGVDDGERWFRQTHGIGMHMWRSLYRTCGSVRVRWRSLLGVVTRVERHVSVCSFVRQNYTCGSRLCQMAQHEYTVDVDGQHVTLDARTTLRVLGDCCTRLHLLMHKLSIPHKIQRIICYETFGDSSMHTMKLNVS